MSSVYNLILDTFHYFMLCLIILVFLVYESEIVVFEVEKQLKTKSFQIEFIASYFRNKVYYI